MLGGDYRRDLSETLCVFSPGGLVVVAVAVVVVVVDFRLQSGLTSNEYSSTIFRGSSSTCGTKGILSLQPPNDNSSIIFVLSCVVRLLDAPTLFHQHSSDACSLL